MNESEKSSKLRSSILKAVNYIYRRSSYPDIVIVVHFELDLAAARTRSSSGHGHTVCPMKKLRKKKIKLPI